jgi:hypothetical protein
MGTLVKIRNTTAWCMSVAIIVGCSGGFKSRTFSRQEVNDYFAKLKGPAANSNNPSGTPVAHNTNTPGDGIPTGTAPIEENAAGAALGNESAGIPAIVEGPEATAPVPADTPISVTATTLSGADSKVFIEELPPEDSGQLAEQSTQQFDVKNPDAGKIVRGIDVSVSGAADSLVLNMRAIVNMTGATPGLGADLKFLTVANSPVNFVADGQIAGLSNVSVRNAPNWPEFKSLKGIGVRAWCVDSVECRDVQVRLEVTASDKVIPAIFAFQLQEDGSYLMTNKNLADEDYRTFDAAKAILDAQVRELHKPATGNVLSDPSVSSGAQQTTTPPPAAPGTAPAATAPAVTAPAVTAPAVTAPKPAATLNHPEAIDALKNANPRRTQTPVPAAPAAVPPAASAPSKPAATPALASPTLTFGKALDPQTARANTGAGGPVVAPRTQLTFGDPAANALARARASRPSTPPEEIDRQKAAHSRGTSAPAASAKPRATSPTLTFGKALDPETARANTGAGGPVVAPRTHLKFGDPAANARAR